MKILMKRITNTGKSGLLLLLLLLASGAPKGGMAPVAMAEGRWEEQSAEQSGDDSAMENPEYGLVSNSSSPNRMRETIDTTGNAGYMTRTERDVVIEINMMRTDPARYAQHYLAPLRSLYQGNLLRFPGKTPIMTSEGRSALDECIRELEHTRPVSSLAPSKGLKLAARDHTHDQGRTGSIGHTGSDGSSATSRISRYGQWDLSAGENISYGYREARKIVMALLIDDGVSSRGHRKNLLNNSFRFVGVDIGPHRVFGDMCVMDFAGGYTSN